MAHLALKPFGLGLWLCGAIFAPSPLVWAPLVSAQESADQTALQASTAAQLHQRGAYEAAIEQGRREATAQGYTAAAKSGLFLAAYRDDSKDQALERLAQATIDAQAATRLAPDSVDAGLQLSIAIGYAARIKTSVGLAKDARSLAEQLLEQSPKNAYVLGLLGGWHGEAIAAYGKLIAKVAVGARTEDFETYFDQAIDTAPNNPLIVAYYTRLLLDINDEGMRDKARQLLSDVSVSAPANAFEAYMKERALELRAALEAGDKKQLKALIKAQRAFRNSK